MNAAYLRVGLDGCDKGSGYLLPRLASLSAVRGMTAITCIRRATP